MMAALLAEQWVNWKAVRKVDRKVALKVDH